MRKISNALIYLGCLLYLITVPIRIFFHLRAPGLILLADVFFLIGFVLFAFVSPNRLSRYRYLSPGLQKVLSTFFCFGMVLFFLGHILKTFHSNSNRYFIIPSLCIIVPVAIIIYSFGLGHIILYTVLKRIKGKPTSIETLVALGLTVEDLDKYEGVYANEGLPLKITIKNREATLVAQATGQAAFYLEAVEKNVFRYTKGGIVIEFNGPDEFILKQRGGLFPFKRETR
jgi:hypothetical protein